VLHSRVAVRDGGRPGVSEVREISSGPGFVQGAAGGPTPGSPGPLRRRTGPRRRRGPARGNHAPGGSRSPPERPRLRGQPWFMPAGSAAAQGAGHPGVTGAGRHPARHPAWRIAVAEALAFAERTRRRVHPPLRTTRMSWPARAPSASRSSSSGPPGTDGRGPGGRRRASRPAVTVGGQGPRPGHRGRRRARAEGGRAIPGLTGGRASGIGAGQPHHGRRHLAVSRAGRQSPFGIPVRSRPPRVGDGVGGKPVPRSGAVPRTGQAGGGAGRGGPGSPPCSRHARRDFSFPPVVVLLSGGNIDPLATVQAAPGTASPAAGPLPGLSAAGLPDRPGFPGPPCLGDLADLGANVPRGRRHERLAPAAARGRGRGGSCRWRPAAPSTGGEVIGASSAPLVIFLAFA